MSKVTRSFTVRRPELGDTRSIHDLLLQSTGGLTKITETELREDLFSPSSGMLHSFDTIQDPSVEMDSRALVSKNSVVKAFVVGDVGSAFGYVIFHYHYSPWMGHSIFIDDLFVKCDNKAQERILLDRLVEHCKNEAVGYLVFKHSENLTKVIEKYFEDTCGWYRDDTKDWSVNQIVLHDGSQNQYRPEN